MTVQQKYVLVVLIGWIVPLAIVFWFRYWLAAPAVAIAWWHGYMASRLEAEAARSER